MEKKRSFIRVAGAVVVIMIFTIAVWVSGIFALANAIEVFAAGLDPEALDENEAEEECEQKQISDYDYDEDMAIALAQLMWAEARGCSKREQSMIAWTVLNRVDVQYSGLTDFWSILTQPNQFAYWSSCPYEEYEREIAIDVLQRWAAEKDGVEDSGRTLPKGYLYYYGDGAHNYFSTNGSGGSYWFDLGDPYS